jgi:hypothetical protein
MLKIWRSSIKLNDGKKRNDDLTDGGKVNPSSKLSKAPTESEFNVAKSDFTTP